MLFTIRFGIAISMANETAVRSWFESDSQLLAILGAAIIALGFAIFLSIRAWREHHGFIQLGASPLPPKSEKESHELPRAA
jgi:hypothetical protein